MRRERGDDPGYPRYGKSLQSRSAELRSACRTMERYEPTNRPCIPGYLPGRHRAHINCSRAQHGSPVPILEEATGMTRACGWNLGMSQMQKQMNEIISRGTNFRNGY